MNRRRGFIKQLSAGVLALGPGIVHAQSAIAQSADGQPAAVKFALNRGPDDSSNAPFLYARD